MKYLWKKLTEIKLLFSLAGSELCPFIAFTYNCFMIEYTACISCINQQTFNFNLYFFILHLGIWINYYLWSSWCCSIILLSHCDYRAKITCNMKNIRINTHVRPLEALWLCHCFTSSNRIVWEKKITRNRRAITLPKRY